MPITIVFDAKTIGILTFLHQFIGLDKPYVHDFFYRGRLGICPKKCYTNEPLGRSIKVTLAMATCHFQVLQTVDGWLGGLGIGVTQADPSCLDFDDLDNGHLMRMDLLVKS